MTPPGFPAAAVAASPGSIAARWRPAWLLALAFAMPAVASGDGQRVQLQAQHRQHVEQLARQPSSLPLTIESSGRSGRLEGVIQVELEQPFAAVERLLGSTAGWCGVMELLPNMRRCEQQAGSLRVWVARRFDQPIEDTRPLDFDLQVGGDRGEWLQAQLAADEGPLGTRDYRIDVRAIAVGDGRTFLHLDYGHAFGFAARTAARLYLSTSGRDKVGFSVVGHRDGAPVYVDGLRGAIERNAMRLYLAVDARLRAAAMPTEARHEAALTQWLSSIGEHPRQLAEDDPDAYFAAKRERVELADTRER